MKPMYKFKIQRLTFNLFLILISGGFIGTCLLSVSSLADSPDPPPSVSGGRALWTENCQPCHGPTGKGDGPAAQNISDPMPDFSNPETAQKYTPAENFKAVKEGHVEKLMPPWGNRLSDDQIWDLTAYVWSLSTNPKDLAAGEVIYTKMCTTCHGSNGNGDGPQAPASIKIASFTDLSVMAQRSQADLWVNYQAIHKSASPDNFSEAEIRQALDYIRSFSFKLPQRNGVLKGQVLNATTNEPKGNQEVTLHVFEGNTEVETKITRTDSAGNYTFEKLSTDDSTLYQVEGRYKDVTYFSSWPGVFTPDNTETTLDLDIYDTTTSAKTVSVTQLHYFISFAPDMLNVAQIFVLGNSGNQTYIGQNGQTFSFLLPQNVKDVTFQNEKNGDRFIQTGSSYADTAPIPPGEESQSIVAMYGLPYQDQLTIKIPLPADIAAVNVFMQDQGAQLSSEQLQFEATRDFQGQAFLVFKGTNLKKGEDLALQLTNLNNLTFASPAPTPDNVPDRNFEQNLLRWVIIGLGGVVIILITAVYPLWKTKLLRDPHFRSQLTPQPYSCSKDSSLHRQKLVFMLARLDELFETGELDKQIYHRARAKYKAELVELMEK